MSAQILTLARTGQPTQQPQEAEVFADAEEQRLRPARGITIGVIVSLPAWAVAALVAYLTL
jgi:hypothetical protein